MRLSLSGLEKPIEIVAGMPHVLEVENQALFARLCQSLRGGEGRFAPEPYTVWDEEAELKPDTAMLFVDTPLDLPWDDKALMGEVAKRFERMLLDDEELRGEIDVAAQQIASKFLSLGMELNADYSFGIEWDIRRFAKTFGFGIDRMQKTLLDSLIDFLSLALDARCQKTLVFVNLKNFLTESELRELYRYTFFSKVHMLLLENRRDEAIYEYEQKRTVDLHFLEF